MCFYSSLCIPNSLPFLEHDNNNYYYHYLQSGTGLQIMIITIWCIFSFLFIGRELTTWPENNCLQISVLLQIIFCSCVIEAMLSCENGGSVSPRVIWHNYLVHQKNGDQMIKQWLNSVIAKYRDLSVSRRLLFASAFGFDKSACHW